MPPLVHPVYRYAKASPAALRLTNTPSAMRRKVSVGGKEVVTLPALGQDERSRRLTMICTLEPRSRSGPLEVRPVAAVAAVRALAPSTLAQQVGGWEQTWGVVTAVARSLPVISLRVGPDPRVVPDAVRAAASA